MRELAEKLHNVAAGDVRVRVAIMMVIAAVIGWQFLPAWVRLAVVLYTGWPIVGAAVLAGVVGWMQFNWNVFLKTAGAALVCLLVVNAIAVDNSGDRCTGYIAYGFQKSTAAMWGSLAYLFVIIW